MFWRDSNGKCPVAVVLSTELCYINVRQLYHNRCSFISYMGTVHSVHEQSVDTVHVLTIAMASTCTTTTVRGSSAAIRGDSTCTIYTCSKGIFSICITIATWRTCTIATILPCPTAIAYESGAAKVQSSTVAAYDTAMVNGWLRDPLNQ